ncbi:MAG TPA: hypothetical protein VNZ52_11180 [Candidatus Thermoplasmatota archaeon]|nr:hypothetical protein [Candidatus Thermoplasmatota archaeon]
MRAALAFALAFLLLPLGTAVPASGSAALLLEDTFEGQASGWVRSGGGVQPRCSAEGDCVLLVDPECCSTYSILSREARIPLEGTVAVSVRFLGADVNGDTDTSFDVLLGGDRKLSVSVSEAWSPNTGVGLYSEGTVPAEAGPYHQRWSRASFAQWSAAGEWHTLTLRLSRGLALADALVHGPTGELLAASPPVPLPVGTEAIEGFQFTGVLWSRFSTTFEYDDLRVVRVPDGTVLPPPVSTSHVQERETFRVQWEPVFPEPDGYRLTLVGRAGERTVVETGPKPVYVGDGRLHSHAEAVAAMKGGVPGFAAELLGAGPESTVVGPAAPVTLQPVEDLPVQGPRLFGVGAAGIAGLLLGPLGLLLAYLGLGFNW